MDTSKAAPTWLDNRLDDDANWSDGVPVDADPWVASAFEELASLSTDELMAAASADVSDDAWAVTGDELPTAGDDAAPSGAVVDVGAWLDATEGFTDADDVAFVVDDADLAPTGTPAAGLVDPFDALGDADTAPIDLDVVGLPGDSGAPVPADDIVTTPTAVAETISTANSEPAPASASETATDVAEGAPTVEHEFFDAEVGATLDPIGDDDGLLGGTDHDVFDDADDAHAADDSDEWTDDDGEWLGE